MNNAFKLDTFKLFYYQSDFILSVILEIVILIINFKLVKSRTMKF